MNRKIVKYKDMKDDHAECCSSASIRASTRALRPCMDTVHPLR
jgi:hypothetical protein